MNVAELQKFLRSLSEVLQAADEKKVSKELQGLCTNLEPLKEYGLEQFSNLLLKAAGIAQAEPVGKKSTGAKTVKRELTYPKNDPDRVSKAKARLEELDDKALDPTFNRDEVKTELIQLGEEFTVPDLKTIAAVVGVVLKKALKPDLVNAIIQAVIERRGAHARAGA